MSGRAADKSLEGLQLWLAANGTEERQAQAARALDWSARLLYISTFVLVLTCAALSLWLLCYLTSSGGGAADGDVDGVGRERRPAPTQTGSAVQRASGAGGGGGNIMEALASVHLPIANRGAVLCEVDQTMSVEKRPLRCVACSREKYLTHTRAQTSIDVQQS